MTTDLVEAEYHQFGRNTATTCRATFLTVLASKTHDQRYVAAAERGRLEVLADSVEGVHIVVATERTTVARVRADDGLHDVTRGHLTGWTCSCPDDELCCHILATQQITEGVGE